MCDEPMVSIRAPHLPGLTLGDRVGDGANLAWWPAHDRAGREVTVRVIDLPDSMRDSARTRLERWRDHQHRHLMRVIDVPTARDGHLVVVSERLIGADLGALVRSRGAISQEQAESLVANIAGALHSLHAQGIVHADISPRNLLLTARGWVLVDGTDPVTLTEGTPGFAAPARARGATATAQGDVYALAAALAWALGGRETSDGAQQPPHDATRPQPHQQDLDDSLTRLLDAASQLNPSMRPTARELETAASAAASRRAANQDLPISRWQHAEPEDLALGNLRAIALAAPTRIERSGRRPFVRRSAPPVPATGRPSWRSACVLGVLVGFTLTGAGLPEPSAATTRPSAVDHTSTQFASSTSMSTAEYQAMAQHLLGQRDLALAFGDRQLLTSLTTPGSPARARDQHLIRALEGTRLHGLATTVRAAVGSNGQMMLLVTQRSHLRIGRLGVQAVPSQPTRCVLPCLVRNEEGQTRILAMREC